MAETKLYRKIVLSCIAKFIVIFWVSTFIAYIVTAVVGKETDLGPQSP